MVYYLQVNLDIYLVHVYHELMITLHKIVTTEELVMARNFNKNAHSKIVMAGHCSHTTITPYFKLCIYMQSQQGNRKLTLLSDQFANITNNARSRYNSSPEHSGLLKWIDSYANAWPRWNDTIWPISKNTCQLKEDTHKAIVQLITWRWVGVKPGLWTDGLDRWTGPMDWTDGLDQWTGVLKYSTMPWACVKPGLPDHPDHPDQKECR